MMQTTANLWEILCKDYQSERSKSEADDCCEVSRKFLAAARVVLRENSARLIDALEIVGDVFQSAGQLQSAIESFKEALGKARQIGAMVSRARLCAKLALMDEHLGPLSEVLRYGEEAITCFEKLQDMSQQALLLNQLGSLCRLHGDTAGSLRYYHRARDLAAGSHGMDHPDVATALNNLGVAYTEAQNFVQAESLHMQALGIREKNYGTAHPEVAQSMGNLAVMYHSAGAYDKAGAFYRGAIDIYQSFRAPDDPELQTLLRNYAMLNEASLLNE